MADMDFDNNKPNLEDIKKQYEGRDIAECFAQLHINFSCEIHNITHKINNMDSRVGHLERFAEHTSTSLTEVAEETKRIENNVDEKLTKEAHERLKLEMWGGNGIWL